MASLIPTPEQTQQANVGAAPGVGSYISDTPTTSTPLPQGGTTPNGTVVGANGAVTTPPPSSTITSSSITPQSPVNVGTPPPPPKQNFTDGSQATIDALNKQIADLKASSTQDKAPTDLQGYLDKYLSSSTPPPSEADQYNKLYDASGVDAKQQAYTKSQNELDAMNAQLSGLNYQYNTTIPEQAQQDATGRGVTVGGLAPITAAQQRQKLLEIAPLQFQTLLKQAEVTGNQRVLQAAQDHLDTMFKIQSQDSTNQYNYQKDLRDKVYQFATDAEKRILDQQQHAADLAHSDLQDTIKNAQDLAKTAIDNNQPELAAKISALDPKSPTYKQDLSNIEGQMKNPTAAVDLALKQAQLLNANLNNQLLQNGGGSVTQSNIRTTQSGINYIDGTNLTGKDATLAQKYGSQNGIAYMGKDQADVLSNIDTARTNLQNISNSIQGVSPSSGISRIIKGPLNLLEGATQIGPSADQIASFGAYRAAAIQALRAMAGAKGLRINQAEILQSVNQDIPKVTDTAATAQAKIDKVNSLLDSQEKALLGTYANQNTTSTNTNQKQVISPDQIPAGYYQASDGLLYKK